MYGYRNTRWDIAKRMGADYLVLGVVGQIAGLAVIHSPEDMGTPLGITGQLILVLFTGLLVGGCAMYARHHRLAKWWALLGLFNFPGVILLLMISGVRRQTKYAQGFGVVFAEPYKRHVWRMDVKVRLDETVGAPVREPIMLQLSRGANVGAAMKTLAGVIPGLNEGELPEAEYSINGREADRREELNDGDELVVRVKGERHEGYSR